MNPGASVMQVWVVSYRYKTQWTTGAIYSTKDKAIKDMKRRARGKGKEKGPELELVEVEKEMWMLGQNFMLEGWEVI